MASTAASAVSARPFCPAVTVQRPKARSSVIMCAARQQQEQKPQQPNKLAQVAAAGLVALYIAASPVIAADGGSLKSKICASNPTSKICLRDSVKK